MLSRQIVLLALLVSIAAVQAASINGRSSPRIHKRFAFNLPNSGGDLLRAIIELLNQRLLNFYVPTLSTSTTTTEDTLPPEFDRPSQLPPNFIDDGQPAFGLPPINKVSWG